MEFSDTLSNKTEKSIRVFLAHEDIEGGVEWEDAIIENLKSTDFFMPLLSPNFEASEFTDQEQGIAYVLGRKIIPVSLVQGSTPYGFIKKIHAVKFKIQHGSYYEWMKFVEEIISIISKDPRHGPNIKNLIIRAFKKSDSFDVTNNFIQILGKYEPFDKSQVNEIIRIY